jgi:hypothetical protein
VTEAGRRTHLGTLLRCARCDGDAEEI